MSIAAALIALGLFGKQAQPLSIQLPAPRHGHRAHLLEDRILVMGGYLQGSATSAGQRDVLLYDLKTSRWSKQPPMQAGRSFFASVVVDGWVYALGRSIERFRPGRASWEKVYEDASLPSSHFGAAAVGRRIIFVGKEVQVFDTSSRKLSPVKAYPGKKPGDHFEVVASLRGRLHVIGGLDADSFQPQKRHFVLENRDWRRLPDLPMPLFAKFAAVEVAGDVLYFLSAEGSFSYDSKTEKWKALKPMPIPLVMPACVHRRGWIYVLGGMPEQGNYRKLAYEVKADRWHKQ